MPLGAPEAGGLIVSARREGVEGPVLFLVHPDAAGHYFKWITVLERLFGSSAMHLARYAGPMEAYDRGGQARGQPRMRDPE